MGLNKDFKVKNSACVGDSLMVTNSACIGGDTTIYGNLSVYGDETVLRTIISTTSALSVINHGTGPALYVKQAGSNEPIAQFVDHEGGQIIFADSGDVGIGTTTPSEKLTVAGNISSNGGLSAKDDIYLTSGNIVLDEDQRVYFEADRGTWIESDSADRLRSVVGGKQMFLLDQDTGDRAVFGFGTKVGINIGNNTTPTSYLTVAGDISSNGGLSAASVTSTTSPRGFVSAGRDLSEIFSPGGSAGGVGGSGTTCFIPAWEGSTCLGNSIACITPSQLTVAGNISAGGSLSASGLSANYFRGNVGIGTLSPTEKLTIAGNLTATGDIRSSCGTVEGKLLYARNCVAVSKITSQYMSDSHELCLQSGKSACVRIGTSCGWAMTLSANCDNVARVGIGGTIPGNEALTVAGNISAGGDILTDSISATGLSANYFNGNVGIGISSPAEKLTVCGNISASGTIMGLNVPDIGTGTAGYITKWEDANTIGNSIAYELSNLLTVGGSISSTGALSASGAGYNYFNGRVGIGTDTPSHKLNVAVSDGDDGIVLQKAGSSNDLFKFSMDGTNDKAELFQYSNGTAIFAVRPTNVGYINTGQNFGIGTASPTEQLTVAGNLSAGGNILTNSISAAGLSGNYFEGKVGIGTSRPNEKLTVKGNISACGSVTAANVCGVTSVCGATVCGTSYVCGAIVTDGSSCMDGSGNVCGCYFCAGNDVTASGGTVCGYYGCFTYLYCGGSQVYANNIPNSCLANSSVSYGGVSVALGASDATPAFCLCDGTAYKGDTSLVRGGAMFVDSISSYGGLSATATTRGFVSAGRDLADIFATSSGNVDGSGTANYLPVWSDTDTIGNSIACQSSTQLTVAGNISAGGSLSASGLSANYFRGRVGVGVPSPQANLHVSDSGAPTFRLSRTGTGQIWQQSIDSSGRLLFTEAASEGGTQYTRLGIDDAGDTCLVPVAGNVGIGTTSPTEKLHVDGSACVKTLSAIYGDSNYFAGCIGIGTNSPATDLHIKSASPVIRLEDSAPDGVYGSIDGAGGSMILDADRGDGYDGSNIQFRIDNQDKMRILSGGNVGIGTIAPARKLDVVGDAQVSTNLVVGTALYTNDWTAGTSGIQYIKNSSGSTSIAIENGGNVGIGTSAPAEKLTVAGSISSQGYCSDVNSNTKIGTDALDANTTGDQNTALGHCALNDNTTGGCNVAIGHLSLKLNISGDGAVAIGYGAGCKHNIDQKNVYVGYEAGRFNTYGTGATFIGECAGFRNTTGGSNTAIGNRALEGNTVGGSNVSIGVNSGPGGTGDGGDESMFIGSATGYCNDASYQVMIGGNAGRYQETGPNITAVGYNANRGSDGNTTGYYNTSIGSCANYAITTAGCSTAVGYKASFNNTTGAQNTTVGVCALHTTTIGGENVSVGYQSLYNNITGGCLVAIGNKALCSNNCTGFSTAVGHETLMTSITGANNTAVGFRALCKVNAIANTAVGTSALRNTTAGTYNEAFGVNALFNNTNGCQNVGIGTHALYSNTANNNTAVGNNALRSNTTGTFNTGVGLYAGCNNNTGDCNIMFGYAAGRYLANGSSSLCAPENSTYIGTCTRGNTDEENNAIVIGYCACSCGSNTISLGNANITNTYLNGSLSSNGTITSEAVHVSATTNGFVSAGRDLADIFATSSGNVDGSGTANYIPVWSDTDTIGNSIACQSSTQLTVAGNISATGYLSAGLGINVPDSSKITAGSAHDLQIYHDGSNSYINETGTGDLYICGGNDIIFKDAVGNLLANMNQSNSVELYYGGSKKLETASGGVDVTGMLCTTDNIRAENSSFMGGREDASAPTYRFHDDGDTGMFNVASDILAFSTGGTEQMRISSNGYVGIGTTAPAEKLTVAGNISAHGGLSATGARSYFACNVGITIQANDNALSLPDSAILALGTSSDLQLFHSAPHSYITNTQNEGNLIIQNCGNNHDLILKTDDGYGGTAAYLQLDGGNQEVYISTGLPASAGNVGIGTTAPAEKLTVSGNISANGGITGGSVTSPDICGTTSVCAPAICGTTSVISPVISGTTSVCGVAVCGTTSVTSPAICGTTSVCGGIISDGSSCLDGSGNICAMYMVKGACICGTTSVISPVISGTAVCAYATTNGFVSAGRDLADIFATSSGNVDGSGTANVLPVWSDTDTLTDSIARQSTGQLTVAGNISATGYLSAGLGINVPDSSKITAGSAHDLQIYHGSDDQSYISNVNGPGNLYIQNCTADKDIAFQADNGSGSATTYFKLDGSGVNTCVCQNFRFADNVTAGFGSSENLKICHTGSLGILTNNTGHLYLQNSADNSDIYIQSDDGYGSTVNYIVADGGEEQLYLTSGLPASAGEVGIGTSSPDQKLTVAGNLKLTSTYPRIFLQDTNNDSDFSIINNDGNFGIYDDTNAEYRAQIIAGGNFGIGTTAPAEKLTVAGNISAQGSLSAAGTSPNYFAGNVGIGTTTPAANLHVVGDINIEDGYYLKYNNSTNLSILGSSSTGTTYTSLKHHFKAYDGSVSYSEYMTIDTGGCVGIGTTSPNEKLTVVGNISADGNMYVSAQDPFIHMTDDSGSTYSAAWKFQNNCQFWEWGGGKKIYFDEESGIRFGDWGSGTGTLATTRDPRIGKCGTTYGGLCFTTGNSTRMVIQSAGNVGIGTDSPGEKLTVAGNISAHGSLSATGTGYNYFNSRVGIGTASPDYLLEVNSNTADNGIRITSNNTARHAIDLWTESGTTGGGDLRLYAGVNLIDTRFRQTGSFVHAVCTGSNFGVGTCTPNEKLTVAGNISASGNGYFACVIAGGYFEEKAASAALAEYPTGSLVVIGCGGNLELSTKSNDKNVFGVTQNGVCQPIVLGAEPVLVTGDINIGDFITTSDKAGHGKRTLNTINGTVIAQAMEAGCGCSYTLQAMIRKM